MQTEIKKLPQSEVEIIGEIDAVTFEGYRNHILEHFAEDLEVPGFRKGKLPLNMVSKYVSEMNILEEMAEHAISHEYPKIIEENKIDAIGRPEINITKIASGNPLGFRIKVAVLPEIKLPDYKKIAKEENEKYKEPEITDKEIDDAILELRRMRARGPENKEVKDEELPAVDGEFLKSIGNFKDEAELRAKIKDNINAEKIYREKDRIRVATLEKLIGDLNIEIPKVLVDGELENLFSRIKNDIARMGLTFEGYLQHLNKKEEDMRTELRPDAEKRAKIELLVAEIAKAEKIVLDEKRIEEETAHLVSHHKDADPIRARIYVTHILTNEKVFQILEDIK